MNMVQMKRHDRH